MKDFIPRTESAAAIICLYWAIVAASAHGQWFRYRPAGCEDGRGILREVISRCDEQGKRTAYDPSQVTWCHEGTHMLNSRIRNSMGGTGRVNAFYVGHGRCICLREPRVTLRQVAQYVTKHRNSTYQLYFGQQLQWWNNEPLYVLDEWTAYVNGSQAAKELSADPHGTYERAQWFCHYADALVAAVEAHDPTYPQLKELKHFVAWQKKRVDQLTRT